MKKQLLYFTLSLALVAFVTWSCDNGNADPVIIDGPPVIESLTVTAGTVENTDFAANAVVNDGIQGSTISVLANATWSITGPATANGSQSLSGDQATVNIAVAGGFPVGDYTLDLTVTDSNGNAASESVTFTVGLSVPDFDISGDWMIEPVAGAMRVGPEPLSGQWFATSAADVVTRACQFDDVYTFAEGATGTFSIDYGDATWLEARFQGVPEDQCGTPVDPFVSGDFEFVYTETSLTLIGQGAAVGIAKVNNTGELGNDGITVQDQIVYDIVDQTVDGNVRRMTLQIEAGDGVWWTYQLISGMEDTPNPFLGSWKIAPEAGAIGVGGSAGDITWWSIDAAGVADRACYFDDTWTFDDMGNMTIDMGDDTWLEGWQAASEGCGAPTDPFVNGTFGYSYTANTLTVEGVGAFVGLQKVNNGKELTTLSDAVGEITYSVAEITETTMTLQIQIITATDGEGWWQFKLVKAE